MDNPESESPGAELETARIDGVEFHCATEQECAEYMLAQCQSGCGGHVVTPNVDILRQIWRDPEIRALVERADLVTADGMPIVWASRLQGTPLPERVAGSNLIWALSEGAAKRGLSVFLLGGDPGTAEAAAAKLQERNPELRVAGTYFPEFGFEKDPEQVDAIRRALTAAKPDIVFVGLNFPKSSHLVETLRDTLPGAWWLIVGISFSYVAGDVRHAPVWMRNSGLEWLHRMVQEPRRLVSRYLQHGVPFALGMLARAALARGSRS